MHSLFGVSKAAADLMVQEYGRYFDMPTVCFRGGCLTGPPHAGAQLHGFLAYLMRCTVTGEPLHGLRLRRQAGARQHPLRRRRARVRGLPRAPRASAAVYNLGGGRASNCSMLEAIARCERIAGRELDWTLSDEARMGDHRWWISDLSEFQRDYPDWRLEYDLETTLREIHDHNVERWTAVARDEALGRHPGAQRGGGRSAPTVGAVAAALEAAGRDYEIVVVDDASTDGTGAVVGRARRARTRASGCCARTTPNGFGFAVRAGLDALRRATRSRS